MEAGDLGNGFENLEEGAFRGGDDQLGGRSGALGVSEVPVKAARARGVGQQGIGREQARAVIDQLLTEEPPGPERRRGGTAEMVLRPAVRRAIVAEALECERR